MMRFMVIALAIALIPGCLMDSAGRFAGFTQPSFSASHGIFGTSVRASSDFAGNLVVDYDPETGELHAEAEVSSDASKVVSAEGERADHLVELRRIESEYKIESQRLVGENFRAFGQMLALAAAGGGEAIAKVIDAGVPLLKGSSAHWDLEGLGSGGATLGAAQRAPPVDPQSTTEPE